MNYIFNIDKIWNTVCVCLNIQKMRPLCLCVCMFLCCRDGLLLRTRPDDMVSVLHTNLLGSMLTCRAALRSMLGQGGAIVNIGNWHNILFLLQVTGLSSVSNAKL